MAADMRSVVEYLHKKHGIDEQLFSRILDSETVIEQVGLQSAEDELESLKRYAKHLLTLSRSEQKNLFKDDAQVLKLQQEEMDLERTLVKLLGKVTKSKDVHKADKLFEDINQLINRLKAVIALEEQKLSK